VSLEDDPIRWIFGLSNGIWLGRDQTGWFVRSPHRESQALVGPATVGGLPLLEWSPEDLAAALSRASDSPFQRSISALVEALPLRQLLEASVLSDYWADLAIGWVQLGSPNRDFVPGLRAIEADGRLSQGVRHRALRLRASIEGRTHNRRSSSGVS
jgi:hypothetical protein